MTAPPDAARKKRRHSIPRLSSGVHGLDTVLGGGLPEFSFNLIAGGPGAGKTTLAQQIAFANATPERPALCFTILGEPTLKILRYQQTMDFFDASRVNTAIRYLNLSEETLSGDLQAVLDRLVLEVEKANPSIVIVDSFRTLHDHHATVPPGQLNIEQFVQRLALHLTTWEVTSFLIGEYALPDQRSPVFTVADGVLWLSQFVDRNTVVRKLQVLKSRGHPSMNGLHTFRITNSGLQVFPRIPDVVPTPRDLSGKRLSTGVPGLNEMMGGGIPSGDAVMIAGPAGSGKTTLATQFVAAAQPNESAVVVVFEEYPDEYLARAALRCPPIRQMKEEGRIRVIYLRPLGLSVDEALHEVLAAVKETSAARLVIDSLSGFEVSLAPAYREDFRESLYRVIGTLTSTGVTVLVTAETPRQETGFGFTTERVSFITDDLIILRFVEDAKRFKTLLAVVKMRGSDHSRDFRPYILTADGARVAGAGAGAAKKAGNTRRKPR